MDDLDVEHGERLALTILVVKWWFG